MAASRKQVREAQWLLRNIGWPISVDGNLGPRTREAVEDFKRGFNLYGRSDKDNIKPFRQVDGRIGPVTLERLRWSARQGGRCSRHFTYRECKSKGNGWIRVHRALLAGMEEYRDVVGHGVDLSQYSVYRDPAHNKRVGGASSSQHMYGNGVDLVPELPLDRVKQMRRFSGIGIQGSTGKVRHVDVRHVGPNNTTGGTVARPTIWTYPG
jgi:zinc D-Ala-D-Ala carboxypeptidase